MVTLKLPCATINAQGVTDDAPDVTDNSLYPLPGVALALWQEVAPVRLLLRARLAVNLYGIHQAKAADKGGVAVGWDKSRLEADGKGHVLLASPEPGDDMRKRYGAWVRLTVKSTRLRFVAMSCHRPIQSTGDKPEFDRNLTEWVREQSDPVVIGLDVNGSGIALAEQLGLKWRGIGIDGFMVSPGLDFTGPFDMPRTRSDHRPVGGVLRARTTS